MRIRRGMLAASTSKERDMPTDITAHSALVLLAAGFLVGLGWSLAAWLVARATRNFG